MSSNLIGPDLDKTDKITKDKNVNEEKETEESKVDNAEEARVYITPIKNKDSIVNAYNNYTKEKDYTVNKVEESRATSVYNGPNEITQLKKITKPSELIITKENLDLSVLYI